MSDSDERAERLRAARQSASIELGLPDADLRVKRFAMLAVQHEDLSAEYLVTGADFDALSKLESHMAEIKATTPSKPLEVALTIVSRAEVQKCPECSHEFAVQKAPQTLEERQAQARLDVARTDDPGRSRHTGSHQDADGCD
jgi:hypothetical protein